MTFSPAILVLYCFIYYVRQHVIYGYYWCQFSIIYTLHSTEIVVCVLLILVAQLDIICLQ